MTHRNLTSFEWVVLGRPREGTRWSAFFSSGLATSVAMETWPVEHRVFVYDAFVKSGKSVSITQWLFWQHFNTGRHGAVPSRNTILLWVNNFLETGSVMKKKAPGSEKKVRTPENIARVRQALVRSPA